MAKMPTTIWIKKMPPINISVTVKIAKRLRFRQWLAIRFIKVGAWLLDADVSIERTYDA
jgi:hypothetical protein